MIRSISFVAGLTLALSALIGGAMLYGRARTSSNRLEAFGLNTCGDRQCFMGITPGESSWTSARQFALDQGGSEREDHTVVAFHQAGQAVQVFSSPHNQAVSQIYITLETNPPDFSFGEILREYV